ncbi:unnamed protein product, partial [Discosporangium mesarthrocarpum]
PDIEDGGIEGREWYANRLAGEWRRCMDPQGAPQVVGAGSNGKCPQGLPSCANAYAAMAVKECGKRLSASTTAELTTRSLVETVIPGFMVWFDHEDLRALRPQVLTPEAMERTVLGRNKAKTST